MQPKDKVIKEMVVCLVYHISYEDCDASYIGEIERSRKANIHGAKKTSSVNSEVSKHINCGQSGHIINLSNAKILSVKPMWFKRGVREAIQI